VTDAHSLYALLRVHGLLISSNPRLLLIWQSDDLAVEMLASLVHDLMSICEDPGVVARCGVESAASGKLFFAILERADVKTRKVVRWLLSST